jgi:hypothetical protein
LAEKMGICGAFWRETKLLAGNYPFVADTVGPLDVSRIFVSSGVLKRASESRGWPSSTAEYRNIAWVSTVNLFFAGVFSLSFFFSFYPYKLCIAFCNPWVILYENNYLAQMSPYNFGIS